jgi:signal transduction histidine kinase
VTRRLLAASLVLITFMLVVLGVPFWRTINRSEREALRTDLERDAVVLASLVEDSLSEVKELGVEQVRADAVKVADQYRKLTGARVVIVDATGLTLADNDAANDTVRSFKSRPEVAKALSGQVGVDQRYSQTLGRSALFVAVPVSSSGKMLGAVRLSYTTAEIDAHIHSLALRLVLAGSLAVAAAIMLAVAMARSLDRPLVELRKTAQAFGTGNLAARAPTNHGAPEVRALGVDFNTMASRIEQLVTAQDAFVSDASHQLRSPLTAARLRVEALAYAEPDQLAEGVDSAVEELSRLSRIIDGLLELARAERSGPPSKPIDVVPTIRDRVDAWSALADERDISIVYGGVGPVLARANPERLAQILDNLVANAVDATAAGGAVRVSTAELGDKQLILVEDDGVGMTEEQRQRAFDRLWRADSRRTELSGSGLGLPIARKLARADGGDIVLLPGHVRGTQARISYPVVHRI